MSDKHLTNKRYLTNCDNHKRHALAFLLIERVFCASNQTRCERLAKCVHQAMPITPNASQEIRSTENTKERNHPRNKLTINYKTHFESRCTIYLYLDFGLITAVFGYLSNALAPPPIALESCPMAQTSRLHLKIIFFGWGCGFFVSDVIIKVVLGSFWLMFPGLGPHR